MSSDFEEAVIAFAQSLKATWGDAKARAKCKRELLRFVDAEYGEDCAFSIALKAIVENADVGANAMEPDRRSKE
ncbi:MAG: hypothetical protein IKU71_03440 [Kiritimatiellae bacterium]|nr:hypothetical protein [Kiritimatiellia bacterium]